MYFLRFATRHFELLYSQDNCTAVCRTDANEMLYTYIALKLSGGNKDGNWLLCKFKSRAKLSKLLGYWISQATRGGDYSVIIFFWRGEVV